MILRVSYFIIFMVIELLNLFLMFYNVKKYLILVFYLYIFIGF